MVSKERLRAKLKTERASLSDTEVDGLSEAIINRLIAEVDWSSIRSVHCYQPIKSLREIKTTKLLNFIHSEWPEVKITLQSASPRSKIKPAAYDLVVVPTLGFDKKCYRLGAGGGFYDKFLATQLNSLKIGLAYEQGLIKSSLPAEPHDIPLDIIITEGIIVSHESNPGKDR